MSTLVRGSVFSSVRSLAILAVLSSSFCGSARAIVDGTPVAPGEWPQVFAFRLPSGYNDVKDRPCTGFLAHPRILLTQAHCLPEREVPVVANASNGENIRFAKTRGKSFEIARTVRYPWAGLESPGISESLAKMVDRAQVDFGYVLLKEDVPSDVMTPLPIAPNTSLDEDKKAVGEETMFLGYGPNRLDVLDNPYDAFGQKRSGVKTISAVRKDAFVYSGSAQSALPGDSGGPVLRKVGGEWRVTALLSRFNRSDTGEYKFLVAGKLQPGVLCWIARDAHVDFAGVDCSAVPVNQ